MLTVLFGMEYLADCIQLLVRTSADVVDYSAATNTQTQEGVAIKKVTNVFSKKILAKRALREIKLLQHFRGHRNVSFWPDIAGTTLTGADYMPL